MQQWQLPCGLILLGVITALIYLWWDSDTLSPEQSGSSTFGGFLSGLFLALGLSLCYHYRFLDDPYSLGWLLQLWIVLSGGLWYLKTRQRAMNKTSNQLQRKRRHFQLSPRLVQLNGKALLHVSLVVGLVVSMVSWIRSLVPGSPFYQATGSLYQAARALPYLQSPDLLAAVLTVNSFIVKVLIPMLVNPWPAFFLMGIPAAAYVRYLTRIEQWYRRHTFWETTVGRVLTILKPIVVGGALGVNGLGLFLLIFGYKVGVSSHALCGPMIFTFPFSIVYHGYRHMNYIRQVELESSNRRSITSIGMFSILLLLFLTTFFNPPVSSEQTVHPLPTDTSFEGYVAETAIHLYNPETGGFVMQEGMDEPNLQATYYGIKILQDMGKLNRLESRTQVERFVMGFQRENGQFGEGIEDTYYAVSILNSMNLLLEEIKYDVERYLQAVIAFPLSLEDAYSNDVGVAYWGIRICRELDLPLTTTLRLPHYGEDDLYIERKPQQREDEFLSSPTGGEQFAVSVDVLETAVIPAFFVSSDAAIPRLEFKVEFTSNETVIAELLHDGMSLEQRTVDGRAGDGTVFLIPFPKAGQYAIRLTRPDVKSYAWIGDEDGSGGAFEWQFNRQATPTPFLISISIPCFDAIPFSVAYDLAILSFNSTSSFDLLITDSGDLSTFDSSQNLIEQLTFKGDTNETASLELEKNAYNFVVLTETPENVNFSVHQREYVSEPLGTYLTQDAPLVQFNQGLDAYSRLEDLARLAFVYEAISEPGYEQYVYDREYVLHTLMKHYNTTSHLFERDGHIAESYWGAVTYGYLEQDRFVTDSDGSHRSISKSAAVAASKTLIGNLAAADTALLTLHKQWYHEENLTETRKGITFLSSIPLEEWDKEWTLASTYFGVQLARQIGEVQHTLALESSRPNISIHPTSKVATSSLLIDRTSRFDFKQALGFTPIYSTTTSFVRLGRPLYGKMGQEPYLFQKKLLTLSLALCMSFAFPFRKRDLVKFWALVFLSLFVLQLPAVVGAITENTKELFQKATDWAAWQNVWDRLMGKTEKALEKRFLTTLFSRTTRIYEPILKPASWRDVSIWLYNMLAGSGGVPRWQSPVEQISASDKPLSSSLRPQELNPQQETQAQTDVNPVSIVFPTLFLQRCGILSEESVETLIRILEQRSYFSETPSADSFKEIRFEVSKEDLVGLLGEVKKGSTSEASLTQYAVFVDEDGKEYVVSLDSLDLECHPELQTLHKLNVLLGYVLEQNSLLRDAVMVVQATNALHTTDLLSSLQGKEIVLSADMLTREVFLDKLLSKSVKTFLEDRFKSEKLVTIQDFVKAELTEISDLLFGKVDEDGSSPFMMVTFKANIRNQDSTIATALPITAGGFLLNTDESLEQNLDQLGERYSCVLTAQRKAFVVLVRYLATFVTGSNKGDYQLYLDHVKSQRFLELLSTFQTLFTRLDLFYTRKAPNSQGLGGEYGVLTPGDVQAILRLIDGDFSILKNPTAFDAIKHDSIDYQDIRTMVNLWYDILAIGSGEILSAGYTNMLQSFKNIHGISNRETLWGKRLTQWFRDKGIEVPNEVAATVVLLQGLFGRSMGTAKSAWLLLTLLFLTFADPQHKDTKIQGTERVGKTGSANTVLSFEKFLANYQQAKQEQWFAALKDQGLTQSVLIDWVDNADITSFLANIEDYLDPTTNRGFENLFSDPKMRFEAVTDFLARVGADLSFSSENRGGFYHCLQDLRHTFEKYGNKLFQTLDELNKKKQTKDKLPVFIQMRAPDGSLYIQPLHPSLITEVYGNDLSHPAWLGTNGDEELLEVH